MKICLFSSILFLEVAKNRPVYKHKWDVDDEDRNNSPKEGNTAAGNDNKDNNKSTDFDGDFDEQPASKPSTIFKPHRRALLANSSNSNNNSTHGSSTGPSSSNSTSGMTYTDKQKHAAFYTVKQAHQIQEIGEFQEMDDDVEYILDTLQPKYPILTRCLSASVS